MAETETTCRREIELEIPAENVQKETQKIARDLAKVARVPGFRPGKAPVTLILRRFAEDIQGEVVQSLVPDYLEQVLNERKLVPVTRPEVDQVKFDEGGPLKFRARFEVLPQFELQDYKDIEVQVQEPEVGDAQVDQAIEELRQRAASYVPVEDRPAQEDDYVELKLTGVPSGGGDTLRADNVVCHLGAEETLAAFSENLRGVRAGETKHFAASYPKDYPDPKLAGKVYDYSVEVRAVREKRLPELNDEFAKDIAGQTGGMQTLADLRANMRQRLEAARDQRKTDDAREKILEALVQRHDFPVPEALVEQQMDTRLERVVHSLALRGVDPRAVNVDWVSLRNRQRERAISDVKAEILLDRVATAESIEASDEDLDKEITRLAERSGESPTSLRARLTKQEGLDRMKSKIRTDKALDWLQHSARIQTTTKREQ